MNLLCVQAPFWNWSAKAKFLLLDQLREALKRYPRNRFLDSFAHEYLNGVHKKEDGRASLERSCRVLDKSFFSWYNPKILGWRKRDAVYILYSTLRQGNIY